MCANAIMNYWKYTSYYQTTIVYLLYNFLFLRKSINLSVKPNKFALSFLKKKKKKPSFWVDILM